MSYGKVNKTTGERIPYAGNSSGGTSDYTDLTNKPSINNVTLSGNKTASDLSLASTTDLATKQDKYETISYAQWQALTPTQKAAKDYYISDYPSSQISAGNVSYSNTSSGMSADDVQGAVDELASEKKDEYTTITYSQWSALTPTQKAAKDYYISDYPSSAITAGNVSYNNSSSGMVANNVQSAVDELKSGLNNLVKSKTMTVTTDSTGGASFDLPSGGTILVSIRPLRDADYYNLWWGVTIGSRAYNSGYGFKAIKDDGSALSSQAIKFDLFYI